MKIAKRVKGISSSATLEITSLAKKMSQQGQEVVNFAAGEPDFDTPAYIKKAAISAIKDGFTKYTPATGILELKQAVCKKLAQDNNLHYSPSDIVISCGAKHTLYNVLQVLCERGDEVIIFSPYWVSYPEMVRLAQAKVKIITTRPEAGFKPDQKSLLSKITKKTKVLILNSPANPTGSVYSRDQLLEIAEVATKHKLYVISDEIYEKLIFDHKKHISYASLNKKTYQHSIVVNGVSKTFSMTGWRIGYLACANQRLVQVIGNLQSHSTSNPCSISQRAALAALTQSKDSQLRQIVKEFQSRRDCMFNGLIEISRLEPFKPEGAFYIFCGIAKLRLDSFSFSHRLLNEAKIAVIPGCTFGRDDYVRLSFATSLQQIQKGLHRLKDWVKVT